MSQGAVYGSKTGIPSQSSSAPLPPFLPPFQRLLPDYDYNHDYPHHNDVTPRASMRFAASP
jgi:hypothetical protein